MKLILIRHGLPVRSDSSADPSLAPQGVRQSEQMARWLHSEGVDALYTSPMRRARETAEPLAALTGLHRAKMPACPALLAGQEILVVIQKTRPCPEDRTGLCECSRSQHIKLTRPRPGLRCRPA